MYIITTILSTIIFSDLSIYLPIYLSIYYLSNINTYISYIIYSRRLASYVVANRVWE
jgi:hypothetical protein